MTEDVNVAVPPRVFSSQQVQLMQAMGLVPWVRHSTPPAPAASVAVKEAPAAAVAAPSVTLSHSHKAAKTGLLSTRLLRVVTDRGLVQTGVEHAPLLVIDAMPAEGSDASVGMSRVESELLDLMLRAIDLERTDYSLCALAGNAAEDCGCCVADLLTPGRRAVLLLDSGDTGLTSNESALHAQGRDVALYSVNHPRRLLAEPAGKRQVWQTLKRLRACLQPVTGEA